MNYQEAALAEAIANVWGAEDVGPLEQSEAKDLVKYLNDSGWRIVPSSDMDIPASAGPLQRALGMTEEGEGF